MSYQKYKKIIVVCIFILFIGVGIAPSIIGNSNENQDFIKLTFYSFDRTGTKKCKAELSKEVAKEISDLFDVIKDKIISNPYSKETYILKIDFVDMLEKHNLISERNSKDYVFSLLEPRWNRNSGDSNPLVNGRGFSFRNSVLPDPFAHTGSSFFCSMAGGGSGVLFPPIMMPRPRLATVWSAYLDDAISIASNLYTGHGFAAFGSQLGVAFGFWGIGLSFAVPGQPAVFGFGGYALAAFVGAEDIETYPPNQVPIISEENPSDGSVNIPTSLSELSFRIGDGDGDHMSYTVTTNPDIGSGSGSNVVDGVYSVPVSGLNSNSMYSWHVVVSDSEDVSEETFSFRTAKEAPFVSDPLPVDGDDWVSVNISELSFRLEDFQGDLMDYSVETVPDIGSGSGNGVGDGIYSVPVGNLEYTRNYIWFVNVTDGEYWTRRIFSFKTQPMIVFDPFEEGWNYRKKITINHSMVSGDLIDFPMLFSIIDSDIANKAQSDGDDILFMDGSGIANRLFHEIETYDGSNGELISWINLDNLSSNYDKILYVYYGNINCDNQQYTKKVWSDNYCGVWHLHENPTYPISDSTINNNNGLSHGDMTSTNLVDGKIGNCLEFDGINDYISVQDSSSLKPEEVTLIGWFKPLEQNPDYGFFLSKKCHDYYSNADGHTYGFCWRDNDTLQGGIEQDLSSPNQWAKIGNYPISIDNWYHLVLTFDESTDTGILYVNGIEEGKKTSLHSSSLWYNNPWDFLMGASRMHTGSSHTINDWFKCQLDEIRVINSPINSNWVSTEYINQYDPSSFYSVGPEESEP